MARIVVQSGVHGLRRRALRLLPGHGGPRTACLIKQSPVQSNDASGRRSARFYPVGLGWRFRQRTRRPVRAAGCRTRVRGCRWCVRRENRVVIIAISFIAFISKRCPADADTATSMTADDDVPNPQPFVQLKTALTGTRTMSSAGRRRLEDSETFVISSTLESSAFVQIA